MRRIERPSVRHEAFVHLSLLQIRLPNHFMCSCHSPEVFKNREPFNGELVDVWTLGTILFCMLTGNRSYQQVC
jgi:hypothetical protein